MLVVVRGAVSLGVKLRSPKLGWFMGAGETHPFAGLFEVKDFLPSGDSCWRFKRRLYDRTGFRPLSLYRIQLEYRSIVPWR